jgi:hypothetical protein
MVNLSSTPWKNVGSLHGMCHVGFSNQGIGPSAHCPLQGSCLPCRAYFRCSSSSAPCVEAQVVLCPPTCTKALRLLPIHTLPTVPVILQACPQLPLVTHALFSHLSLVHVPWSELVLHPISMQCSSHSAFLAWPWNSYQIVQSYVPKDNYSSVIVVSMCGMFAQYSWFYECIREWHATSTLLWLHVSQLCLENITLKLRSV